MGKKDIDERLPEPPTAEVFDPFVGGEEDDLSDMEYVQNEHTESVDTQPPETKAEAEARAQGKDKEVEDPTPPEEEVATEDEVDEEIVDEADTSDEDEADTPKIPKERFDEINARMKKAEARAKELEEKLQGELEQRNAEPEAEPFDYKAKEQEAVDAILEGDTERYAEIQAEIRVALRQETLREAENLAIRNDNQVRELETFEATGARIEAEFPQFSMDSANYHEEARQEMLDLFVGYANSGLYTRSEALQKAADRTVRMYQFGDPAPASKSEKVVNIQRGGPKNKVKVAGKQPPAMQPTEATGTEEARHDFSNMSDEEFDALPDSTKARARGDIL